MASNRPLSPHLQIWKWGPHMLVSILHRITGDAPLEERLAPRWDVHKSEIRDRLIAELERRGTSQGALFKS